MDAIDEFIRRKEPRTAVVAGGGFIGLEMAEALHSRGLKVNVVEKLGQLMPPLDIEFADMVRQHLESNGIGVHLGTGMAEVKDSKVLTDSGVTLDADLVILSMGVRPELTLARDAGLEIGPTGGVTVNSRMQSSDPSIYVVGDMAEVVHQITGKKVRIPLAGPANRQGRVAGSNAAGERLTYRGALGTSIVKVCDRTAGSTGLTEKAAREAGLETESVYVHANHHAGYYPGAKQLTMKLVFQKSSGRILGAQAFGQEGVDKRIDVIATAISGNLTVEDLESLDLAYAPPYSSANDPVNTLGFVAMNHVRGFSQIVSPMKFREMVAQSTPAIVLDVRNPDETAKGHVPGAHLIPLPQLRDRVSELPKRQRVFVYCQSGVRSYLASRILAAEGFAEIYNVSGGYRSIALIPS
jgi:pyruvate/2-oxoglutarate dehydrogenase complex dihydrolipoamide dehydrogenase (E3) component/rhodanese-related sulfurtransferase